MSPVNTLVHDHRLNLTLLELLDAQRASNKYLRDIRQCLNVGLVGDESRSYLRRIMGVIESIYSWLPLKIVNAVPVFVEDPTPSQDGEVGPDGRRASTGVVSFGSSPPSDLDVIREIEWPTDSSS